MKTYSFPNGSLGTSEIVWNGADDSNNPVASGIYFYKLKAGNHEQVRKMVLL